VSEAGNAGKRAASLLIVAALVGAPWYALRSGAIAIPNEWNPWAPLEVDAPMNWTTRFKLSRVSGDDALCLAALAQSGMRYEPVADRILVDGCALDNAVRVRAIRTTGTTGTTGAGGTAGVAVGEPFMLSCRSALSLTLWERHILQPVSRAYFDVPVTRIEHYGSYACRNIYGRKDAPLSRHATADALDIAGFVLANGRRVSVERDWRGSDAEALFLHDVHRGACRVFDSVLGPEYNAAHRNHLHLDRGGGRVCR
jgi:hypothetical protein